VLEAVHWLGWLRWYRYLALPQDQGTDELEASVAAFLPVFIRSPQTVSALPPSLLGALAGEAVPFASEMLRYARQTRDRGLVDVTLGLWSRIVEHTPDGDAETAAHLASLWSALRLRFEDTAAAGDLDALVEVARTELGDSRCRG
jgi:hypothetical protein